MGRFGLEQERPIDCNGLRVIEFSGEERADSAGGMPSYRNK